MSHDTISDNHHRAGLRLKSEIAGITARLALSRLTASLRERRPDHASDAMADPLLPKHWRRQPRVPAGSPDGGQWTSGGGGGGARVERVSRRGGGPGNRPPGEALRSYTVTHRGQTYRLTQNEYVAYQSSFHRADGLTWLVRQYDPAWRPTPSMSQGIQGAMASQNYTATQATQRLQEINPPFLRVRDINHILTPGGSPVGYVHGRSKSDIRTVTWQEFQQIHAQLTFGARRIETLPQRGAVFQRPDGVIVNFRYSRNSGPTLDLQFPRGTDFPIKKIHLPKQQIKGFIPMLDIKSIHDDDFVPHRHIRLHEVRPVQFDKMDAIWEVHNISFSDYCISILQDHDNDDEAEDFSQIQVTLEDNFKFKGEDLDRAMAFFITHLVAHGHVPMRDGGEVEYFVPEYRYGTKPQEIIDNIMTEWRRRGHEQFDFWELFLGYEPYCGGFYPDEEGEAKG